MEIDAHTQTHTHTVIPLLSNRSETLSLSLWFGTSLLLPEVTTEKQKTQQNCSEPKLLPSALHWARRSTQSCLNIVYSVCVCARVSIQYW